MVCEFFKKCPWGADCHGQCSQIEFVVGMHEGRVTLDFGGVFAGWDAAMDLAKVLAPDESGAGGDGLRQGGAPAGALFSWGPA